MIIQNQIYLQANAEIVDDDDVILIREEQIKPLYEMLNPGSNVTPVDNIKPNFLGSPIKYISGWKGAGKTTMMRWFIKKIKNINIDYAYINCRIADTPTKLIEAIKAVCQEKFPYIPMHSNERQYIQDCVVSIQGMQFFLLLDEIDKPLRNSRTAQKDEFFHYITRLVSENIQHFKIVFTTNYTKINEELSEEVKSFIGMFNEIKFGVYSVPELQQILVKRARKGLLPGTWNEYDIAIIARDVYNLFDGDARKGIEILSHLAQIADTKLDINKIDEVRRQLNVVSLKIDISGYPISTQYFLKSLATMLIKFGRDEYSDFTSEEAFKSYYEYYADKENIRTVSQPQLYKYLNSLEESKLIIRTQAGFRLIYKPKDVVNCVNLF